MEIAEQNARMDLETIARDTAGEVPAEQNAAGPLGGEEPVRLAEDFPLPEERSAEPGASDSAQVQRQLALIARMDPEMKDLGAVLRSAAGPKFREYVEMGLDFVDAYTLAARERLAGLREARLLEAARVRAAGKGHLTATRSRGGEADLPVPQEELELFRALLPGVSDAEFRKYWNRSRKK